MHKKALPHNTEKTRQREVGGFEFEIIGQAIKYVAIYCD